MREVCSIGGAMSDDAEAWRRNGEIVRRAANALMKALCEQENDVQIGHGIAAAWALFFTLWRENGGTDAALVAYVAGCLRDEPTMMREQSKAIH